MYKILECQIDTRRFDFIKPFKISGGSISTFLQLFANLAIQDCESGKTARGFGHCGISPIWSDKRKEISFQDKERQSVELAEYLAHQLRGVSFGDPLEIFANAKRIVWAKEGDSGMPKLSRYICISPIDMGIWDAFCLLRGENIFDALRGVMPSAGNFFAGARDIEVVHTIGIGDDIGEEYELSASHGIRRFKLKLQGNPLKDIEAMEAFFAVFEPLAPRVILDGNEGYDLQGLASMIDGVAPRFGKYVDYIEQPINRDNSDYIGNLSDKIPIFADEMICDAGDVSLAKELGYKGIALKPTAKTISGTFETLPLMAELKLANSIADLTNCPPRAYLIHLLFASRIAELKYGIEINCYKFLNERLLRDVIGGKYQFLLDIEGGKIRTSKIGCEAGII